MIKPAPQPGRRTVDLTGFADAAQGLEEARRTGAVVCMPRVAHSRQPMPEADVVSCPCCGARCWRSRKIPASLRVGCTRCALGGRGEPQP